MWLAIPTESFYRIAVSVKLSIVLDAPIGGDGFNQVFIKLAFGQQFHVQLRDRRSSARGKSKKRPQEIGSIDRLFQIHAEVKYID